MNGKATIADVYEKLGGIEANTKAIIKRLDEGDKRINKNEEKVAIISTQVKIIYGGIGFIFITVLGTVLKLWEKLFKYIGG